MFQFSPFASRLLEIPCLQHGGLPHSEISGSKRMCRFPKLIAAYHVLLRLSNPRHPPYALSNFQIFKYFLTCLLPNNEIEIFNFIKHNMSKNFV